MKLNDLRLVSVNESIVLNEADSVFPWDNFPDIFPPPIGWPPSSPGAPFFPPQMPGWWQGSPAGWEDFYTNPEVYPPNFWENYPGATPENPLLPEPFRPERPGNPLSQPELLDPYGPQGPDPTGPQGTDDLGPYANRGWHIDPNTGEWVYDPYREGGYSREEKKWFDRDPGFRSPDAHPPGSIPVRPNTPTGPGFYGPGGEWVPMVEMPPGHYTPDFNGDGVGDGRPWYINPDPTQLTPRPFRPDLDLPGFKPDPNRPNPHNAPGLGGRGIGGRRPTQIRPNLPGPL